MVALLGLAAHTSLPTRLSPPVIYGAVLNRTLSFSQAQTCFACGEGKSLGVSTVAGGEEILVAGA
jgi:hypothetical protein